MKLRPRVLYPNVRDSYEAVRVLDGIDRYEIRRLVATNESDTLVLQPESERLVTALDPHYRSAGLNPTSRIVYDTATLKPEMVQDHVPAPFIMNTEAAEFYMRLGMCDGVDSWRKAVGYWDDKEWFVKRCKSLGVSIPTTYFSEDVSGLLKEYRGQECFVKLAQSASGLEQKKVRDRTLLSARIETLEDRNIRYIVQEAFPKVAEFSVQIALGEMPRIIAITAQIIDSTDNSHKGNYVKQGELFKVSFSREEVAAAALKLATQMYRMGLRGTVGIDGLLGADGEWVFLEANTRETGAIYSVEAAFTLRAAEWWNETWVTTARSLEELDLASCPLTFSQETAEGILVTNAAPITAGKVGIAVFAPSERWPHYKRELRDWLQSPNQALAA